MRDAPKRGQRAGRGPGQSGWALARGLGLSCALAGCVAIDSVETPNGDIDLSSESEAGGRSGAAGGASAAGGGGQGGAPGATRDCAALGWAFLHVGGRDVLPSWSAPTLTRSCGTAPYRLTALAPRLGSALSLDVAVRTGRVVEATYSTTGVGADGEQWGDYDAFMDLGELRLGATNTPEQQPFQFEGNILGPFGPVPIEVSGCARVRADGC